MVDRSGKKLDTMAHIEFILPSFVAWLTSPGIGLFRSTGSFIATAITGSKAAYIHIEVLTWKL